MTIQRDEASLNIGEPGGGGTWRGLWVSEETELISPPLRSYLQLFSPGRPFCECERKKVLEGAERD